MVFELLVLAGLALLSASWLILARRRRRRAVPHRRRSTDTRSTSTPPPARRPKPEAAASGGVRSCPVCLTEYDGPRHNFCVRDGAQLNEGPPAGPFAQGMICPTCRRGYPQDASFCPEDADELVPYGLFGAASSTHPPPAGEGRKICPECGEPHTSAHSFCGRDGTELVVVN